MEKIMNITRYNIDEGNGVTGESSFELKIYTSKGKISHHLGVRGLDYMGEGKKLENIPLGKEHTLVLLTKDELKRLENISKQ